MSKPPRKSSSGPKHASVPRMASVKGMETVEVMVCPTRVRSGSDPMSSTTGPGGGAPLEIWKNLVGQIRIKNDEGETQHRHPPETGFSVRKGASLLQTSLENQVWEDGKKHNTNKLVTGLEEGSAWERFATEPPSQV